MWSGIGFIFFLGMVFFGFKAYRIKKNKTGKIIKPILYAIVCFLLAYGAYSMDPNFNNGDSSSTQNKNTSSTPSVATSSHTDQTASKQSQKTTVADNETQRTELQALGDWSIQSNVDDFAHRYTKIQNYISQGDVQSAYDEAKLASKRADDLNSKTMNNQDMNNVPKNISAKVRDILKGVDPHLAQGYMLEKQGFDDLENGISNNNVSKISDAKDNFALANEEFTQAKALIDKANASLK